MRRARAHRRSEARLLAELETAIRPGRRATILGYAWWWRYEIGIVVGVTVGMLLLVHAVGLGRAAFGVTATTGICVAWPSARHACAAAAWRIITPHRLRVGFVQARIHSRNGRLPTVLRTSQQPSGERVLLWCPAGVSAADLRSARAVLTAACWATDIRVTADLRHAHLVTLDVIRHGRDSPPDPGMPHGHGGQWPYRTDPDVFTGDDPTRPTEPNRQCDASPARTG